MRKCRFNEQQIIVILKEHEAGMKAAEVCRRHGISQPTLYAWKSKYGGLISESVELCRIVDQHTVERRRTIDPVLQHVELRCILGRIGECADVRPVRAPNQPLGRDGDSRARNGSDVGIIRRAAPRDFVGRGELEPAASVLQQPQQSLDPSMIHRDRF